MTDLILLTIVACTGVLGIGVSKIREDVAEIKELINKKL